ncbi:MAG: glycosyltransferase involved in cell wall biosynthesis [Myxococcota bacterium]
MRILHLYRPRLPSFRAQAIQVLHACHALAQRGHEVTLLADRGRSGRPEEALAAMGLAPVKGLDLHISPVAHSGLSGMWFRTHLSLWWAGAPGLVLARDKRRLQSALKLLKPNRHRILLETHELDSALEAERGESPSSAKLERWLLPRIDAMVANCGGTLSAWEDAYGDALPTPRRACHNAISPSRRRERVAAPDPVIRCLGSMRTYKGFPWLMGAAEDLPLPVELIGGRPEEREALGGSQRVRLLPPVPYAQVPDVLAASAALLLPLQDNLFGRQLTSPLKLWDYLATGVPIIAPDLPSIAEIAALTGAPLHRYTPGDADSLRETARAALQAEPREPTVRTWDQRAAEIEAMIAAIPPRR